MVDDVIVCTMFALSASGVQSCVVSSMEDLLYLIVCHVRIVGEWGSELRRELDGRLAVPP